VWGNAVMRNYRTSLAMLIALMILSSGLCAVFVPGQTGRGTSNVNSKKKSPAPKRKPTPPRRPTTKISKKAKADANELAYWEKIKLSNALEDFKAYLDNYPNGQHAADAWKRLKDLDDAASAAARKEIERRDAEAKKHPNPGTIEKNKMGMELVYVPAGDFMMGGEDGKNEMPLHLVKITEGFYMGRFEVRQSDWYEIMGQNPSHFKGDELSDKRPVEQVSWDDVQSFLKILNQRQDGFHYRLPTEAEWEYACRARTMDDHGTDEMFWGGGGSGNQTHPVGTKQPNAFGLYDMLGNVWEWCQDIYHPSYAGAPMDGSAWLSEGDQNTHVIRGGSWASHISSHERQEAARDKSTHQIGFRVVAIRNP
jgi:formylglycine-generating enzyme required for sulfatase activity